MAHLLNHFSLQAAKWNTLVVFSLIFVWAGVVGCVISSIRAQQFDRRQRTFWIAIVILVPFLGLLAYLPFAFRKEDLPHIFLRKSRHPRRDKEDDSTLDL